MNARDLLSTSVVFVLGLMTQGCGHTHYTHRTVETPAGFSQMQGPARNTAYFAEVTGADDRVLVKVFEQSTCQLLKLRITNRVEETLDGDEVVAQERRAPVQDPAGVLGEVACEKRFSRVPIALQFGNDTFQVGFTSPVGEIQVSLSEILRPGTRGLKLLPTDHVDVIVEGAVAGSINLASFVQHLSRVDSLLAQLNALLARKLDTLTEAEMTQLYQLYSQIIDLDTSDARVSGVQRRFVEVVAGWKEVRDLASLKRNLSALSEAKDLLKTLASAVPQQVVAAIQSGNLTAEALLWAQGSAALAFRSSPSLCSHSTFAWTNANGADPRSHLAFAVLRYAFDDAYAGVLSGMCRG